MVHPQVNDTSAAARGADPTATPDVRGNYLDLPGFMVPGILRAFEAEDLAALAAGGTPPALPPAPTTDSGAHLLLSLGLEAASQLRGLYALDLAIDPLGPSHVTLRIDTGDWKADYARLLPWARSQVDLYDGDALQVGEGWLRLYLRRRGLLVARSAVVAVRGAS